MVYPGMRGLPAFDKPKSLRMINHDSPGGLMAGRIAFWSEVGTGFA
jgi:hypothetical protein